jgi:elongation factor P
MIESSSFKKGQYLVYTDQPMVIVDVTFSSPTARGGTTIAKTKLRNLVTNQLLVESIRSGEKYDELDVEQHPCSYMYTDGTRWHFMDDQTYDQFDFGEGELGDDVGFLKDGLTGLRAMYIDGRVVSVTLPLTVDLEVVECDPVIKGATAPAQLKQAKTETGLVVMVPSYITIGEAVRVDTRDQRFIERVKK